MRAGQERYYTLQELEAMPTEELDRMAFGHASGDIIGVATSELTIVYPCDLENPRHRFEVEGMPWVLSVDLSEPVEVRIDEEGVKCLEDGHHRYFAAQKRGLPLQAQVTISGNPIREILRRQARELSPGKPPHPVSEGGPTP